MMEGSQLESTIQSHIYTIRGERVMLDADLAALYGVSTSRLNEQVRRNLDRFPTDFAFVLTPEEADILRSQIAISSSATHGGRRHYPLVFTEHGAIMAASVVNSPRAVQMGILVVRAFVSLRVMLRSNAVLAKKITRLERKYDGQFAVVFRAIRELMDPRVESRKPIGFRSNGGTR